MNTLARRTARTFAVLGLLAGVGSTSGVAAAPPTSAPEPVGSSEPAAAVQPVASAGCAATPVAVGDEHVSMTSDGLERSYLRSVPPAYDGTTPVPLVIDLHGFQEGADMHAYNSGLGPFGDEHGFVTITPQGNAVGAQPMWLIDRDSADVVFIGDLLDEAEATLCVDLARVYVTGFSNGAMLTSVLACVYADRLAAVAPVSGVADVEGCDPARPVPVVAFHGTDDPYVDFDGGFGPAVPVQPSDVQPTLVDDAIATTYVPAPVEETMAEWAERNGCAAGDPVEEEVADDVTLLAWPCSDAATATDLYRIDGGGHTWPGSNFLVAYQSLVGSTTMSISANEVMWAFFEDHARPPL